MDDFDDISSVLDDLADFDVSSFSVPTPAPQPVQPTVVAQATPVANTFTPLDTDLDLDFGMDFAPPGTTTQAAPTPASDDLNFDIDLSLNDIIDNMDFGIETSTFFFFFFFCLL